MLVKVAAAAAWWLLYGNHFRDSSLCYLDDDCVLSSPHRSIISDDFIIKKQFDSLSLTFCLI